MSFTSGADIHHHIKCRNTKCCTMPLAEQFYNSFTDVLSWKFATKLLIKIPPHLRCAATLPCEMLMFANQCILSSH